MDPFLIDVALALPSGGTFQYAVPEALRERAALGKRVAVSVRSRRMIGYLVGFSTERAVAEVKAIESVVDDSPVLSPELLELTRWMASHYLCSWGQAIEAALPAPFKKGRFLMKSRPGKVPAAASAEAPDPGPRVLTADQERAYRLILGDLVARRFAGHLLYGITGSGKTEVYMHLIRELLAAGRGAIVLVPEISLTPQTVDRFRARFGDCLAVVHSRLAQARRVEEWHRIRSGAARVVVGARSAVFSPVRDLGLIVIDEEHDHSYKQEETPRYHTRDVAAARCRIERAVLLLGSATPSLESYHAAEEGRLGLERLPERIERRPLPEVEIVDLRRNEAAGRDRIFSTALEKAVRDCLGKKEQAMLLLNRRGFATHLHCASCGYVSQCPNCRISLVYHYDKAALFCHLCQYRQTPERLCPACRKHPLHYFGIGTQKVESEASRLFPGARIARMDADSTARKDSHETILRAFRKGEVDILIGTQMIAKGHDFPNVSLIGVISADTALHIPDFRAAERTFDLLTQVAGRAGRGDVPGRVVIQTYVPHHYAIRSAKDHDYLEFYAQEMEFRRELGMPPCAHLVKVAAAGASEREVARQTLLFARFLERRLPEGVKLMGPAPEIVSKEMGQFRWNLYLKGPSPEAIHPALRQALEEFKKTEKARVAFTIDVDPQS